MLGKFKNMFFRHEIALFWPQGYKDADIGHREVACATVQHPLVPVAVNLALQQDDVALLEGQLGRVLGIKVVQGLAGGVRIAYRCGHWRRSW